MMVIPMEDAALEQPVTRWRHVWLLWSLAIAAGLSTGVAVSRVMSDSGSSAPLALEVSRPAADLVIRWNPRSAAASRAARAVVSLTGETGNVQLVCDRACLDRGTISYPWQESSADIAMQFTARSGQVSEERTRYVVPASSEYR